MFFNFNNKEFKQKYKKKKRTKTNKRIIYVILEMPFDFATYKYWCKKIKIKEGDYRSLKMFMSIKGKGLYD